jgi:hypothetical protein
MKFSENAFLGLYQKLVEAPDPAPVLSASLDQLTKLSDLAALQVYQHRL